ncbi:dethiobiotin synthase [Fulvivirgaceae bacterium LMO-SS25]
MDYFITAIGTDSGKTLVSAIFCEAFNTNYWKPIQSGRPKDSDTIANLIENPNERIFPEAYFLKTPVSPHQAAEIDSIEIDLDAINRPSSSIPITIEGAGGLLVPIGPHLYIADLISKFNASLILVSNYYLGSINHSLLSIEYCKSHGIPITGIVLNGKKNEYSKRAILEACDAPLLLEIEQEEIIDETTVEKYAKILKGNYERFNQ